MVQEEKIILRFEAKFIPEPNTGCWIWLASRHPQGYGTFGIDGKVYYAHRVSWLIYRGDLPLGMKVCHSCDNEWCVNPEHLWLGSQAENVADSVLKGRARRPQGEEHASAKLTEQDILSIRRDIRPRSEIAAEYGCTKENIGMIKSGKTWRHV